MKKILFAAMTLLYAGAAFAQPQLTKDNIDEVLAAMTLEETMMLIIYVLFSIT